MAQASRVLKDAVRAYHLVGARVCYDQAPDHVWHDEQDTRTPPYNILKGTPSHNI